MLGNRFECHRYSDGDDQINGFLKSANCSMAISVDYRSKFAASSLVNVTSPHV